MKKLIVISGSGIYPELVVRGAKASGVQRVDVLAVRGSTSRATRKAADGVHEIGIGEIAAGIRWVPRRGTMEPYLPDRSIRFLFSGLVSTMR